MKILDFNSLDQIEQNLYINDTYCNNCKKSDLGIYEPEMYQVEDKIIVKGKCNICNLSCQSEVVVKEVKL